MVQLYSSIASPDYFPANFALIFHQTPLLFLDDMNLLSGMGVEQVQLLTVP